MEQKRPRENDKLDLLKCLAIYGVVFLHILLPGQVGVAVNCLARFSVPLFFLSAGYFSWRTSPKTLGRRVLRTAGMLLASCALLACLGCALTLREGGSVGAYLMGRFSVHALKELVFFQLLPLPYSWAMWFLLSLLFLYVLWWCLTVCFGPGLPYNALALLAGAMLVLHLYLGEFTMLTGGEVNSFWVRNAWLDGLPFFLIGCWMREHRDWWESRSAGLLWGGVLAGALLSLLERSRTDFLDLHVGTVLMVLCLMGAAIQNPRVDSPFLRGTACFCGRHLTFYIYLLHLPLYGVIREWREAVPAFGWLMERPWLLPFVVAAACTLAALVLYGWSAPGKRRKPA